MEPLSMNTLASSLPQAQQQQPQANDLSVKFKDAALAITTLYRASTAAQKRAHSAGYAAALQDVLAFIRTGLSEGAAMDIGTVMDYAEARAAAVADDDEEETQQHHQSMSASTSAHAIKEKDKDKPKVKVVLPSTNLAKENAHTRRRKHSSASPSPPPSTVVPAPAPVQAPLTKSKSQARSEDVSRAGSPVIGTKRRHPSTVHNTHAHTEGLGFNLASGGVGGALQPSNAVEPSQRVKKGKPKSARVPNPPVPPLSTLFGMGMDEEMDVEEERPRKRR